MKIQPHLGNLKEANGVVPHPLGNIRVNVKRKGARSVTAEITLPQGLAGTFVWNNEKVTLKPGKQTINR